MARKQDKMTIALTILGFVLLMIPVAFVIMLIANKCVYGGWFHFPWSYNNPFNVTLREIAKVQEDLRQLGDELESGAVTHGEYVVRMDSIHNEMDRLFAEVGWNRRDA